MATTHKKSDSQTVFRFRIEKSLLSQASSLARKDSRTLASLIRKLLSKEVNQYGK